MSTEEEREGFKSRNNVLKKFKLTGEFGWMQLWIAEDKETKRQFMRLYRYMNWFVIPNPKYLVYVQQLLKKGAEELGWPYNSNNEVKITEENDNSSSKKENFTKKPTSVPEIGRAHV